MEIILKILFSPQVHETDRFIYEFGDQAIKVELNGKTDTFDFSGFPDGVLQLEDQETEEELVETELEINPLLSAKKENGILYVELLNFIGLDATEEECFPEWIDHTEYAPHKTKSESEDEQDERWDDF